jgi:hypothetical protein
MWWFDHIQCMLSETVCSGILSHLKNIRREKDWPRLKLRESEEKRYDEMKYNERYWFGYKCLEDIDSHTKS